MKDYIGTYIPANWHRGKQIEKGELGFSKTGICFYYPSMRYHKGKVEIDCSEIIWIEKKNIYIRHPYKMTIFTKKNAEYTFVVNERDEVVEFLDSKVKYAPEKPVDYQERLRNTPGERIKRQYFNMPLYIYSSFSVQIVILLPILNIFLGKENMTRYTIIDMFGMLCFVLLFFIPLIVLSILNRFVFGRVVCVINQEGVHYEQGVISWDKISNIEYEIELPSRSASRDRSCFARLLGDELDVQLIHAPYYFTKRAKKYNSKIKVKFSKGSKFTIRLWALLPLICFVIVLLLES